VQLRGHLYAQPNSKPTVDALQRHQAARKHLQSDRRDLLCPALEAVALQLLETRLTAAWQLSSAGPRRALSGERPGRGHGCVRAVKSAARFPLLRMKSGDWWSKAQYARLLEEINGTDFDLSKDNKSLMVLKPPPPDSGEEVAFGLNQTALNNQMCNFWDEDHLINLPCLKMQDFDQGDDHYAALSPLDTPIDIAEVIYDDESDEQFLQAVDWATETADVKKEIEMSLLEVGIQMFDTPFFLTARGEGLARDYEDVIKAENIDDEYSDDEDSQDEDVEQDGVGDADDEDEADSDTPRVVLQCEYEGRDLLVLVPQERCFFPGKRILDGTIEEYVRPEGQEKEDMEDLIQKLLDEDFWGTEKAAAQE